MKRALVITGFLVVWVIAMGAQSIPNPVVTRPMPSAPPHNYPFFSTNLDLASLGYVEEEFFFEGTASTYNVEPNVSMMTTAEITSSGNHYKTRMIVRRPVSAENFNGTWC